MLSGYYYEFVCIIEFITMRFELNKKSIFICKNNDFRQSSNFKHVQN